jgi:hypothetical protein
MRNWVICREHFSIADWCGMRAGIERQIAIERFSNQWRYGTPRDCKEENPRKHEGISRVNPRGKRARATCDLQDLEYGALRRAAAFPHIRTLSWRLDFEGSDTLSCNLPPLTRPDTDFVRKQPHISCWLLLKLQFGSGFGRCCGEVMWDRSCLGVFRHVLPELSQGRIAC